MCWQCPAPLKFRPAFLLSWARLIPLALPFPWSCDTSSPSTETHWAEIWMDTFHCSLTQRATPPCSFPISLPAPCSCHISLSGDRARAGGAVLAASGIPLGISRAHKRHQPAWTREASTLAGMGLITASKLRLAGAPQPTKDWSEHSLLFHVENSGKQSQHFLQQVLPAVVSLCCGKVLPVPKAHPQRIGGCSLALGHARTPETQNPKIFVVPEGAIITQTAQSPNADFGGPFQLSLPLYWPNPPLTTQSINAAPKMLLPTVPDPP